MATYRVPVLEDFSWQPPVEDKDLTEAPTGAGVTKGKRYIIAANGGNWSGGAAKDIATAIQAEPTETAHWMYDTPVEGWYVYVKDEHAAYKFNESSAWDLEDLSSLEGDVTSIDTRVSNVESSVGSIDTRVSVNESTNVVQSTAIVNTDSSVASIDTIAASNVSNIVTNDTDISNADSSIASIDTNVTSCDSSIVSIDTRISNTNSSVASINTAKQDKGTYVSEYGAIEFTI